MSISALNKAALEASGAKDIHFLFLDFATDPMYACTGTRTYTWGGNDWLGIGEISGISDIAHASDIAARPLTLTASGVDSFIVQPALSRTNYKHRQVAIYRGFLDTDENLIDDPYTVWKGRMDVGSFAADKGSAFVQMRCEPLAADLLRANVSRYSDQDHQQRWPGDRFFEYLPQMADKDVVWGRDRVDGNWKRDGVEGERNPMDSER